MKNSRLRRACATATPETFLVLFLVLSGLTRFLLRIYPHLNYPFDNDPTDGDSLNSVNRLANGLPLYLNYIEGKITLVYGPVYFALLSIYKGIGLDVIPMARWTNFLLFNATAAGAALTMTRALTRWRLAGVFVFLLLFSTRASSYEWLVNVRTDSLALFLIVAAVVAETGRRSGPRTTAVLCTLAFFTKQTSVVGGIGFFVYYVLTDRRKAWSFLKIAGMAGLASIVLLEWYNRGWFVRSFFIMPNRFFTAEKLTWDHARFHFRLMYGSVPVLYFLAVVGGVLAVRARSNLRVVAIIFGVDSLFYLKVGRNLGGGISYLWLNFLFASMLASNAVLAGVWAFERSRRTLERCHKFWAPALAILAVASAISTYRSLGVKRELDEKYVDQYAKLREHQAQVRRIATRFPRERWFSERISAPIAREGLILDHEVGTLMYAFTGTAKQDATAFVDGFRRGEYRLVQRWEGADAIAELRAVFDECFAQIGTQKTYERNEPTEVSFWHWEGTGPACLK